MTDLDPIVPITPSGPSWRFIAASAAGSLVVHLLVATAIYVEFAHPAAPPADPEPLVVALVDPDQLKPVEPPKPETKVAPPPQPVEPPKPPPAPPQKVEPPKPPPVKADPSQVVPATRDQATPPQGDQAAPTTAQRQSEQPDKPNTQDAKKADPQPDPDQDKPEPKQADAKPPEDPKPADPNGILPKQAPPKPQQQATAQPTKPVPSKHDGGAVRQVMAPIVVRPDAVSGRAGNSAQVSYPSAARANGLQGRVTLQALVGSDGNVRRINIVKSSGYDQLDESAVRAVWLWRFHGSGPIPSQGVWIEIPVDFRLN